MATNLPARPSPFAWDSTDPMLQVAEPLWPGEVPGWNCAAEEQVLVRELEGPGHQRNRAIKGVTRPTMQAFLPPQDQATGMAIVVFPGGAFQHLAIDKEGWDVARWLNGLGVAAFVVKYRTGSPDDRVNAIAAGEADARRAMQIARSRAQAWGLDPKRIGAMGFSAGGHLVASLGTNWAEGQAEAADPVERFSSRPDFLLPVYPGIREKHLMAISAQTPPAFIVQACDDHLPVEGSVSFFQGLRAAKVPVEMHLFERGGHGFGLGVKGGAVAGWPSLFEAWVKALG